MEKTPGPNGSEAQWRSWWKRVGRPNDLNVEGKPREKRPANWWIVANQPLRYGNKRYYREDDENGTTESGDIDDTA